MKTGQTIFEQGGHKWIAIARDPEKPEHFIDTVEYLIVNEGRGCILDPGGSEIFPSVFSVVGKEIDVDNVEFLFASHQDPDIISSLALWLAFNPKLRCYVSWVWGGFVPHYGCGKDALAHIPDEGGKVTLGNSLTLEFVPAHYMHSSGNFHVYDEKAKILFTGDIGAALFAQPASAPLFVKDFSAHTAAMKDFHERWMPSNEAKNDWVDRVAKLPIDMICPQHGAIMAGEDVHRFLDWLRGLRVGNAIRSSQGSTQRNLTL